MPRLGLTRREAQLKGTELRCSRDTLTSFDDLLARLTSSSAAGSLTTSGSGLGSGSKPLQLTTRSQDKLLAELRSTGAELERSSKVLEALSVKAGSSAVEGAEIKEQLRIIETRLDRLHVFEMSGGDPLPEAGPTNVIDPAQADALAFIASSLASLVRLIERTELVVEELVAGGFGKSDQDDVDASVVRLLEWNEEREWLADTLRTAEGGVRGGKIRPERVLRLRDAIKDVLKSDESVPPKVDRSAFRALSMDKAPAKIKEDNDSLSAKSGSLVTSFAQAAAKKPSSRPAVMSRVGWKSSQLTKASTPSQLAVKDADCVSANNFELSNVRSAPSRPTSTIKLLPASTSRDRLLQVNKLVDLSKTSLCKAYYSNAGCAAGASCKIAHSEEEQRTSPKILEAVLGLSNDPSRPYQFKYKERLCVNWMHDTCWHLKNCVMAHGLSELQPPVSVRKVTLCPEQEVTGKRCTWSGCLWLHSSPTRFESAPNASKPAPTADRHSSGIKKLKSAGTPRKSSPAAAPAPVMKLIRHQPAKAATALKAASRTPSPPGESLVSPFSILTEVTPPIVAPVVVNSAARAPAKRAATALAPASRPPADAPLCLNFLYGGGCANGSNCLSRHTSNEIDFASC